MRARAEARWQRRDRRCCLVTQYLKPDTACTLVLGTQIPNTRVIGFIVTVTRGNEFSYLQSLGDREKSSSGKVGRRKCSARLPSRVSRGLCYTALHYTTRLCASHALAQPWASRTSRSWNPHDRFDECAYVCALFCSPVLNTASTLFMLDVRRCCTNDVVELRACSSGSNAALETRDSADR